MRADMPIASEMPVGELLRPGLLQARLNAILPRAEQYETRVALIYQDEVRFAASGLEPDNANDAASATFYPGCITKLLVATLIGMQISRGCLHLSDRASELLEHHPCVRACLRDITLQQLLEHTHGLDDSLMLRAPLKSNGCIDVDALCAELAPVALYEPGRYYSYSSAGAWLLSAILERQYGAAIMQILHDELFEPLGMRARLGTGEARQSGAGHFCAASGGELAFDLQDFVRFMSAHLHRQEPHWIGSAHSHLARGAMVPVPGLSPAERGVRLGWKVYGGGWLGHNSVLPHAAALLRLHPGIGAGFVIICATSSVAAVATALFGRAFPGCMALRVPRLLAPGELQGFSAQAFEGVYANAAERICIEPADGDQPMLCAFRNAASGQPSSCGPIMLRPAEADAFLSHPLQPALPFLQFVGRTAEGVFTHVWDGTLLRARRGLKMAD